MAFADPAPEAMEGRSTIRIVVDRTDLPVSRLVVNYATQDATAQSASDYVETSGSLVFDVGVRSSSFVVQLRDDQAPEPTEHVVLRLTTDRTSTTARLAILDDDAAADAAAVDAASGRATRGAATGSASPPATVAPPPAAPPARTVQQPARRRAVAAPPRRQIVLRQNPVTPFELRPAPPDLHADPVTGSLPNDPTVVDPVLALLAGLLLARVSAEVWFRSRALVA
jgi:hypothetical protein